MATNSINLKLAVWLSASAAFLEAVNAQSPRPRLYVESGINHSARSVTFSPDSRLVAAGGLDRTIRIWSVIPGRELLTLPINKMSLSLAFHPTLPILASFDEEGEVTVWDLATKRLITSRVCGRPGDKTSVAFSDNGDTLLCASEVLGAIRRWEANSFQEIESKAIRSTGKISNLRLDSTGTMLIGRDESGNAHIFDMTKWVELGQVGAAPYEIDAVAFAPKTRRLATASEAGAKIQIWKCDFGFANAKRERMIEAPGVHSIAFNADESLLAYASEAGDIVLVQTSSWKEMSRLKSYSNRVEQVGLTDDSSTLAVQLWYDTVLFWNLEHSQPNFNTVTHRILSSGLNNHGSVLGLRFSILNRKDSVQFSRETVGELCTIVLLDKEDAWVATTPDGRFDTNKDLDGITGVHWILGDDAFHPLALEIFMRDYYEPRLLPRLLAGEELPKVRPLGDLNRVQPGVKIVSVKQGAQSDVADVTVEVSPAEGQFQRDGKQVTMRTDVYDLRLFRENQLVGQEPELSAEAEARLKNGVVLAPLELNEWQIARRVKPVKDRVRLDPATGKLQRTFAVRLPHGQAGKEIEFTGYAFNEDRVKSETGPARYKVPLDAGPVKRRAYVVAMGVNAYENPAWDLRFAVSDAKLMREALAGRLEKQHYEVVPVTLVSDCKQADCPKDGNREIGEDHATKAGLHAVLELLAGHALSEELKKNLPPGAERIRKAEPDDLVMLSVSSHGYTSKEGMFYIVSSDSGHTEGHGLTEQLRQKWISSDELSAWLRDVDAGDLVMIVDTCHSAATVEEPGFKPGPMGSRGLGQLAYDKGMRILAASQADDVALESEKLKQGLLTYALVHDGLEAQQAVKAGTKEITLDSWLEYGSERVPTLYQQVLTGKVQTFAEGSKDVVIDQQLSGGTSTLKKPSAFQQPSLFSFQKNKQDLALQ